MYATSQLILRAGQEMESKFQCDQTPDSKSDPLPDAMRYRAV